MAISFVDQATGTTTATLPAIAAGDLLLVFAYRASSAITPTAPAGFTSITSGAANTNGHNHAWKLAASSADTIGTWANAEGLLVQIYRGVDQTSPVGGSAQMTGILTNATDAAYPAATLGNTSGSSWIAAALGIRASSTAIEVPPTGSGLTNRSDVVVAGSLEAAGSDTNGGVTSWAGIGASTTGTRFRSVVVELKAAPVAITATLAATLGALTCSSTAAVRVTGALTGTLANLTSSASAGVKVQASADLALAGLTLTGSAGARVSASAGVALGEMIGTATGAVRVSAALNQVLGALTLQATIGATFPPINAALAAQLGPVSLAASAQASVKGQFAIGLDDLVVQSAGRLVVSAALSAALDDLVVVAEVQAGPVPTRPPIARRIRVPTYSRRVQAPARPRLVKVR